MECVQRNKNHTTKPTGPLHPLPIPDKRSDSIAIDFIGPCPKDDGHNAIVTITDRLRSDIHIAPTWLDISAEHFTTQFFDMWYCENGLPLNIVSDRDKLFVSKFWKALHKRTGVSLKMSLNYHPETDGSSECSNKTVVQALRYHIERNQKGWAKSLQCVCFAIMNTVNTSTGFSPFQLLMGRSPCLIPPLTTALTDTVTEEIPEAESAINLINDLALDVAEAQDNLLAAKVVQAEFANRHHGDEIVFKEGDKVLLSTKHRCCKYIQARSNRSTKFMPRFDGPYIVTRAFPSKSCYTLDLPNEPNRIPTFHSSLLRPYIPNDPDLFPSRSLPMPRPVVTPDGEEEWFVDWILDERRRGRGYQYLVRWSGYRK